MISATLLLASCAKDGSKNSLKKMCLRGKVKTLEQTETRLTRKREVGSADDSLLGKSSYEFNNRGNISVEYTWQANNNLQKCVYLFNDAGKPVKALKYNSDSSLCYKATLIYDEAGNISEQRQYDARDSLNLRLQYKYDKAGNVIQEDSYWASGKLLHKYVYKYNAAGNDTAYIFYRDDSSIIMHAEYLYNDSGYRKEEHRYSEDDTEGWIIRYNYDKYDKQGNWLERTTYEKEKPVSVTRRIISYY